MNKSRTSSRKRRRGNRGGYLYVAVLFTSLIVAGAVATAISLDTTRIKTDTAAADRSWAIRLAETELHRVAVQLSTDPNWRDDLSNASVSDWTSYGAIAGSDNAEARFQINDADGDLADDSFDDTRVVVHSRFGAAQAAVAVDLETGFAPLNLLRYGVTVFDDFECDNGAMLVSEKPVQVLDDCKTSSYGFVAAPKLECSGAIQISVRGDVGESDVDRPGFDVVERYVDAGTEIPLGALPFRDSRRAINLAVISSSTNPYGAIDANGIYWIDAQGQQISVADSRLEATIAIRNASRVFLTGALVWEAPADQGAILVTDSVVRLDNVEPTLDETALAANFNPPATPYRGMDSNLTHSDRFPTDFRGIIYTSADLVVLPTSNGNAIKVVGSVICYDLVLYHSLFVQSFDEVLTKVPLGFVDPQPQRFKSGTFRRVNTL